MKFLLHFIKLYVIEKIGKKFNIKIFMILLFFLQPCVFIERHIIILAHRDPRRFLVFARRRDFDHARGVPAGDG